MAHEAAGIQVLPLPDPDQVGKLRRGKRARALAGEDAGRNREVDSLDFGRREAIQSSVRVRPQPWGCKRSALSQSDCGQESLFVLGLRGIVSQPEVRDSFYRPIPLSAFDDCAVRHDARMAFPARGIANLDFSPLPDDIVRKRVHAVGVREVAGPGSERAALVGAGFEGGEEQHRCVKDDLACLDPVGFRLQPGAMRAVVPQDNRLLPSKPIAIAGRLVVDVVRGITLVDRPNRKSIVVFSRNMRGTVGRVGQRNFQAGERLLIPCPRDDRLVGGWLLRVVGVAEGAESDRQRKRKKPRRPDPARPHSKSPRDVGSVADASTPQSVQ